MTRRVAQEQKWHLNWPRPAAQWVQPKKVRPEGGQTIPLHHSIAKYLKNLKLMSRTGTFILRHCVNKIEMIRKVLHTYQAQGLDEITIHENELIEIYSEGETEK